MDIKPIGKNQALLTAHGWQILYSFETPVAGYNPVLKTYFRTTMKCCNSTTQHINEWLDDMYAIGMSQDDIDSIGFLIGDINNETN